MSCHSTTRAHLKATIPRSSTPTIPDGSCNGSSERETMQPPPGNSGAITRRSTFLLSCYHSSAECRRGNGQPAESAFHFPSVICQGRRKSDSKPPIVFLQRGRS